MKAILHLTKNCNLRCSYCYAPDKVKESMSVETAKKAIDLVVRLGDSTACVSYFGGEPLLMFDTIKQLTRYAVERGRANDTEMHFRLATNGTLFDEESLAFCRDNNVLFAISLDGDQQTHDAMRILPNGEGSFRLIDKKLATILRYNPHTVVTSVITPSSVGRLFDSIEYMWNRGIRYIVHQLDFTNPGWTPEMFEPLATDYELLADFYLAQVRAGERFHMSLFDDKLKTHARSPIELGDVCDFGTRKLSVAPDGRIFPCVQFVSDREDAGDYCIGTVDTGLNGRRDTLVAENRSEREQCRGCALLGRCANHCGCLNWQTTGSITEVPGILCSHERMLMPIADRIGNELWNERNAHFLTKHYKSFADRFEYGID